MKDKSRAQVVALAVLLNQVREEDFQGRAHLVAPVVALMEMVLRCSNCLPGGELVPAEEIEASLPFWNGVPLPIRHPLMNGEPISARDRAVMDEQVIGHFFEPMFAMGRLTGELWVDIELAEATDEGKEILERLQQEDGATLEVSTSYFAEREPRRGDFKGDPFEVVQRNIRPDHLALLPDGVGACSIQDGCGAPRLNCECVTVNVRTSARRPAFQGTEMTRWEGPTLSRFIDGWVRQGGERPESSTVEGLPSNVRTWIASKTLLGEASADNERDLAFFPVVNPATNKLNRNALRAVLGGRGSAANIPPAARDSAQARARGLLESEFDTDDTDAARHPAGCPPGQHRDRTGKCVPNRRQNTMKKSKVKQALIALGQTVGINLGDTMDRKEYIQALCKNKACPFEAPALEDFTDAQIASLAAVYLEGDEKPGANKLTAEEKAAAEAKAAEEKKAAENKAAEVKAEEEKAAGLKAASAGKGTDALDAEVQAGLKVLAKMGPRISRFFEQEDADKGELIKALAANTACPFDANELADFALEKLEKLAYALAPGDYTGRGGAYIPGADDEAGVPEAPKILTAPLEEKKEAAAKK